MEKQPQLLSQKHYKCETSKLCEIFQPRNEQLRQQQHEWQLLFFASTLKNFWPTLKSVGRVYWNNGRQQKMSHIVFPAFVFL